MRATPTPRAARRPSRRPRRPAFRLARRPPLAGGNAVREPIMLADSRLCRLGIWQRNAAPRRVGWGPWLRRTPSPAIVGPRIRTPRSGAATAPQERRDQDNCGDEDEPQHRKKIDRHGLSLPRHVRNCGGIARHVHRFDCCSRSRIADASSSGVVPGCWVWTAVRQGQSGNGGRVRVGTSSGQCTGRRASALSAVSPARATVRQARPSKPANPWRAGTRSVSAHTSALVRRRTADCQDRISGRKGR
jgi:hypothetical protein